MDIVPSKDDLQPLPVVRVVTLNLWGEQGPLQRRLELCAGQLAALSPDVIALQEVREIPSVLPNTATTLAAQLGMHLVFAGATPWGGGLEGLAILSKRPITTSGHFELPHATSDERRILLWARIPTGSGELLASVTHLNYRLLHGQIREDQVVAIDAYLREQQADVKILAGDFNAVPESDEIRYLKGLHSVNGRRAYYQDAFGKLHPQDLGYTWSRLNPFTQRLRLYDGDRRLDYVFVSPIKRDGRGILHSCRIVLDVPDGDGVYPSDHFGVLAEVQLGPLP